MKSLRPWTGVVAFLLVGAVLAMLLGRTLLSGGVLLLTLAGCAYLAVDAFRKREDPYDLARLHETAPMPEDGREGPEDKSGYCPVCGAFVESPYEPCPRCGSAV